MVHTERKDNSYLRALDSIPQDHSDYLSKMDYLSKICYEEFKRYYKDKNIKLKQSVNLKTDGCGLYYTDTLVAAYMARNFDVKFISKPFTKLGSCERGDVISKEDTNWDYFFSMYEWFIVHLDSQHIFEPQEDDICWWSMGEGKCLGKATPLLIQQGGCEEIIQRNDKHFFMPIKNIGEI